MWKNFKLRAGLEDPEDLPPESSLIEDFGDVTSLSAQQRLMGFFLSLVMGITFIIISLTFIPILAIASKKFAFFFTCGNFFCVVSTMFLVGIQKQVKSMFESHRAQAAAAYVGSMAMTLVSAIHWRSTSMSVFFAVIQSAALIWYGLSYIPFARKVVGFFLNYAGVILRPILSVVWTGLTWICSFCCKAISK